jgi:NAD(P)-dependent dehydrogenase (short-subunit alcohol dehydrogenase family)
MKLQGKTAFITGASRGIGKAVAQAFLAEGARVALVSNDADELAATAAAFSKIFSGVACEVCDVSREEEVGKAVVALTGKLGPLHVLVNAAGIYGPIGPSLDIDIAHWRKTFEVNVFGTLYAIRRVAPGMKERGKGIIINFSGGGDGPLPNFSAYNASKVSVVRLTETLAEELKPWHIDVNCLAPGAVNTKFLDEALAAGEEKVGAERYQKLLKQKREGGVPPEKTAELCVWLASSASDGLTGKFLSAAWDKYQEWDSKKIREIMNSSAFALRRIDPFRKE